MATKKPKTRILDHRSGSKDNISRYLDAKKLVPKQFRGTDQFLDIVSWNIRWFDFADPDRVKAIAEVMDALNADIFVLTEIAEDGALDEVGKILSNRKAGFYTIKYGKTGSQQRVVLMWDRDWVRSKEDPAELFGDEKLDMKAEFGPGRQKIFPRLPFWGYFEALPSEPKPGDEGFTFELVGLHLKAQGPAPEGYSGASKRWGIPQRTKAAERLVRWLGDSDAHHDADVIMVGDWNAEPHQPEWQAFRSLESNKDVLFEKINDESEVSHLVRLNKSGPAGSRIDLHLVTDEASANGAPQGLGTVIKWSPFDSLEVMGTKHRQDFFKKLKQRFSDHLPVVSRFYLTEQAGT
jgi:endonuclease/exonuclease/phosphatase family metal-dependent hydrolase